MPTKKFSLISIVILSLIFTVVSACAQEKAEEPKVEPYVEKLLKNAGGYIKAAEEFSFHAEITFDSVIPSGEKLQFSASQDIMVKRPDKVKTRYIGDLRNTKAWYNGESMTVLNVDKNIYAVAEVPSNIDEAIDHMIEKYNVSVPTIDLIYSDPNKTLMEKVDSGYYVGIGHVNGIPCHHIALQQENIDWQIWIEEGKQFLPRKFIIDYKSQPGSPQYTVLLSDWDFTTKISDSIFEFEAPDGAEEMEFFPVKEVYEKNTGKEKRS